MIKKIQIELIIVGILILYIIISSNFNIGLYNKFYNFNFNLGNVYLKEFFIKITELGNSLWFFLLSFFTYIICFFLPTNKIIINKFKAASLLLFTSLLVTGIITQIIKHIVGRPRPNHATQVDSYNINFFNFDSAFHSFPSGHTSTIFIVALTLSLLTPKIKYFYLFFAFVIGFSRVVVGAHYLTDVIGGIIIAFIGIKITLWIFNKLKKKEQILDIIKFNLDIFFLSLIILFIIIIFLTLGSALDIFISNLFYKGKQIFILQSFSYITILAREIFLPLIILYIVIIPVLSLYFPIKKIYFNFSFNIKKIIFLWVSIFFNNIIIVNLLLKNNWGRARPNDILQLGGEENFSPWFQISDACASNCSFISGDASIGFSLIALFFLTNNKIFYWLAIFSGLFLGTVRILEGGHFLSDIIIAGFIIFILTYIQSIFYKKRFNNDL